MILKNWNYVRLQATKLLEILKVRRPDLLGFPLKAATESDDQIETHKEARVKITQRHYITLRLHIVTRYRPTQWRN